MSGEDILVRVRGALPGLRPAERRVAEAILADPAAMAELSISALARQCTTSETTVMRLCRSLGMERFGELRLALARAASREEARLGNDIQISGDISPTDSLADIVRKIGFTDARAVEDTTSTLDLDALGAAAHALHRARRVDIYGIGASGFVGQDLHQKLHRIGMFASVVARPACRAHLRRAAHRPGRGAGHLPHGHHHRHH